MSKLQRTNSFKSQLRGFHFVEPSPWPFGTATALTQIIMICLEWFSYEKIWWVWVVWSFYLFFLIIALWCRDVIIESTFQGKHTIVVQKMMKAGVMLVLVSETMFFFGFFWCFLYMAVSPSVWIGGTWPPYGIEPIHPLGLPLLNTVVLLSSGVSATFAHKAMKRVETRNEVLHGLAISIVYGIIFTCLQVWEYTNAPFSISDGIYGSIFYVATGFHGLHVIIGTVALIVCFYRQYNYHFQVDHHVGLDVSMWYWHFVDVIWILLYLLIYCWGFRY